MIHLHPPPKVRRAEVIPAVLVVVLALTGPAARGRGCDNLDTDGPQFKCWLEHHAE